ncbi:hypothetical protein, partial [Enterobacter cloacae]|uniref:hypothetical protein n=1 Tax=Enterobacter cloacae TaxID=550 RepID=UPI001B801847
NGEQVNISQPCNKQQVTPVATYCGGIADAFHSTCNQCSAICSKMLFDIAVHISVTLTLNISLIFIYLV